LFWSDRRKRNFTDKENAVFKHSLKTHGLL